MRMLVASPFQHYFAGRQDFGVSVRRRLGARPFAYTTSNLGHRHQDGEVLTQGGVRLELER